MKPQIFMWVGAFLVAAGMLVLGCRRDAAKDGVKEQDLNERSQSVVVGGHEFQFAATGNGSVTVVLWGGIRSWRAVQVEVGKFSKVVSVDRISTNVFEVQAYCLTAEEAVVELRSALELAHVAPPYVLVGHSFGGALARVFANRYPKDVAGLVLVDPFQEQFVDWLRIHQPANHKLFVQLGQRSYASDWETALGQIRAASSFPSIPVTVLSANHRRQRSDGGLEQGINAAEFAEGAHAVVRTHREWLARQPMGKLIEVEGASHDLPKEHPALVVEAVRKLVTGQTSLPR